MSLWETNGRSENEEAKAGGKNKNAIFLILAAISLCVTLALVLIQNKTAPQKTEIDLSHLGTTMIYAELASVFTEPEKYNGTTFRMHGSLEIDENEIDGKRVQTLYCTVQDTSACCSIGLPFVLEAESNTPLPSPGTQITVRGVFGEARDEFGEYHALKNAVIEQFYD